MYEFREDTIQPIALIESETLGQSHLGFKEPSGGSEACSSVGTAGLRAPTRCQPCASQSVSQRTVLATE